MADRDYELKDVLEQFRRDGSLIQGKARVLVEEWLDKVYPRMVDPDLPTSALMDIGKTLIELGDLKPKKELANANAGPGFSITINIPQPDGKPPITIEGSAQPSYTSDEDDTEEDHPTQDMLPVRETNYNTQALDFNIDLMGGLQSISDEGDFE